jgi:hypothetical protein
MSTATIPSAGLRRQRPVRVARPTEPARRAERRVRSPRSVRLTRRGRLAVVAVLAVLLFAAFSLGRVGAEGSTSAAAAPQLQIATVMPGETLWAVAKRIAPGQDPRPVVARIQQLNDLPGAGIRAGQQLVLPVPA